MSYFSFILPVFIDEVFRFRFLRHFKQHVHFLQISFQTVILFLNKKADQCLGEWSKTDIYCDCYSTKWKVYSCSFYNNVLYFESKTFYDF